VSTTTPAACLELALARPPTLGAGRLICVDGPAGSGKTTWAAGIERALDTATGAGGRGLGRRGACAVVHMDDLFEGWSGLAHVDAQLERLLVPLADGRTGTYRRYDWTAGRFAEEVRVEPAPLLLLEGVGSGSARFASLVTLLVWVEAPHDLRMRRGIDRDGDAFAPHWERWAHDEAELFARERTRERAEVIVDGTVPLATTTPPAGSRSTSAGP
jgi:uridine kinase